MTDDVLAALATDDPTSIDFWAGAERGELIIQQCLQCGAHQFYPRPFCLACDGAQLRSTPACGRGTVYSQTTVRRPVVPGFDPPYTIGIIELVEGVRLMANIVNGPTEIGDEVSVTWMRVSGLRVPAFEPTRAGEAMTSPPRPAV